MKQSETKSHVSYDIGLFLSCCGVSTKARITEKPHQWGDTGRASSVWRCEIGRRKKEKKNLNPYANTWQAIG
jgi:hypothetical protein